MIPVQYFVSNLTDGDIERVLERMSAFEVEQTINKIPEITGQQKSVILMRYADDMDKEEVAESLVISTHVVCMYTVDGLLKITEEIKNSLLK